jgi:hypothetical protein
LKLLHPDPQHPTNNPWWVNGTLKDCLTVMYAGQAEHMRSAAKAKLHERVTLWGADTPKTWKTNIVNSVMSNRSYGERYVRDYKLKFKRDLESRKALGSTLTKAFAAKQWGVAHTLVDNNRLTVRNVDDLLTRIEAKALESGMVRRTCGHWDNAERTPLVFTYNGTVRTYCESCERDAQPIRALHPSGQEVLVDGRYNRVYTWSDGTTRTVSEPPAIGSYHHSKGFFTQPFANPDGSQHKGLSLGVELEFVMASGYTRSDETCVRAMYADLAKALPKHAKDGGANRYCAFERDGSVDFEMVTGYGSADVHRVAMMAMFGGNPYGRDLRSHDGGRCGIHVHMDKPKSLLHAMKLAQFWHSADNAALIKAIARRYDAGARYAKVCPDKMKANAEKRNLIRNAKSQYQYNTPGAETRRRILNAAISRINSERYELLNFHNDKTVEVRAFRGSLRAETIIACIEFAQATWFFCRDTPAHKLTTQEFCRWISAEKNRGETGYIRRYLSGKGFDVWLPKEPKVRVTTVRLEEVADTDADPVPAEVISAVVPNNNWPFARAAA